VTLPEESPLAEAPAEQQPEPTVTLPEESPLAEARSPQTAAKHRLRQVYESQTADLHALFQQMEKVQREFCIPHVKLGPDFGVNEPLASQSLTTCDMLLGRRAVIDMHFLHAKDSAKGVKLSELPEFKNLHDYVKKRTINASAGADGTNASAGADGVSASASADGTNASAGADGAGPSTSADGARAKLNLVVVSNTPFAISSKKSDMSCMRIKFVSEEYFMGRWNAARGASCKTILNLCQDITSASPKREILDLNFLNNSIMDISPVKNQLLSSYERYSITFGGCVSGSTASVAEVKKTGKKSSATPDEATPAKAKTAPPVKLRTGDQLAAFVAERNKRRSSPSNDFHSVLETTLFFSSAENMFADRVAFAMELSAILTHYEHHNSERAALFKYIIPIRIEELRANTKWKTLAVPALNFLNEQRIRCCLDTSTSPFIEELRKHGFSSGHLFVKGVSTYHDVFSAAFSALANSLSEGPIPRNTELSAEGLVDRAMAVYSGSVTGKGKAVVGAAAVVVPNFRLAFKVVTDFMTYVRGVSTLRDRELAHKLAKYLAIKADKGVSAFVNPEVFNALEGGEDRRLALMEASEHFVSEKACIGPIGWLVPCEIEAKLHFDEADKKSPSEADAAQPGAQPGTEEVGDVQPAEAGVECPPSSASVGMLADFAVSMDFTTPPLGLDPMPAPASEAQVMGPAENADSAMESVETAESVMEAAETAESATEAVEAAESAVAKNVAKSAPKKGDDTVFKVPAPVARRSARLSDRVASDTECGGNFIRPPSDGRKKPSARATESDADESGAESDVSSGRRRKKDKSPQPVASVVCAETRKRARGEASASDSESEPAVSTRFGRVIRPRRP
jgi:hypothetical protein